MKVGGLDGTAYIIRAFVISVIFRKGVYRIHIAVCEDKFSWQCHGKSLLEMLIPRI